MLPKGDQFEIYIASFFDYARAAGYAKTLKKEKIKHHESLENTDLASWQGKETSELVSNIYDKIKDLKTKYPLAKNSKKILWKQRVRNAQKRIMLLLKHAGG